MSAKKKSGLGKGLGALLAEAPAEAIESALPTSPKENSNIGEILLSQIEVNPFQPRTDFNEDALNELAESIKVQGIIQPITVRRLSESEFQLISGERRFQASIRAGLETVPAYIRSANDQQMLEMALIENIQRENLNAIEIALSYQRLMAECNLKQEQLGDRVGKNRSTVTNYLRLLKLPPDIQVALRDGQISMGHARALISIDDVALQLQVFGKILSEGLSVRKVEEFVRNSVNQPTAKQIQEITPEIEKLQDQLSSHFGTRIKIKSKDNSKGQINIPFTSTDDLNRILDILEM